MASPHILVPVDFSDCSFEVVRRAASLAQGTGGSIKLLHVVSLDTNVPLELRMRPPQKMGPAPTVGDFLHADALRQLERYREMPEVDGLWITNVVELGRPAARIVAVAADLQVRLIVMGTHGRRGLPRILFGSVAEEVMRSAPCPVMTVRTLHKATCAARSCAYCPSGGTSAQDLVAIEESG